MYKRVLVPLDGSKLAEQILPYARAFAQAFDIPVELLRVNDPDVIAAYSPPLQGGEYLKAVSARYLPSSLQVNHTIELGKAAEVIVVRADAEPGCLIAMATHGLSGLQRWLLGSVASKVVQLATHPLLLVRPVGDHDPAKPVELKTVFVPLDGSGLAEKILPHVTDLARKMRLAVHLVRVYSFPPESYIVGDGLYMDVLTRQRTEIQQQAESYLDGKVEELRVEGLDDVLSTAIEGDAAGEIIDLARKTPDNLIAMSTHGRSGVGRWVLGSVTEKVIQHSHDPVLVIRPS